MLREARESMHVDIAVLAAMLKVPEHKLLALEADRFEALPDLTFARALAASVCRTLQIDPAPVLAKFPQPAHGGAQRAPSAAPINAPYRTARESSMAARTGSVLQARYIWLVLAILLGAVVLALLPNLERLRLPSSDAPAPVASAPRPLVHWLMPALLCRPAQRARLWVLLRRLRRLRLRHRCLLARPCCAWWPAKTAGCRCAKPVARR